MGLMPIFFFGGRAMNKNPTCVYRDIKEVIEDPSYEEKVEICNWLYLAHLLLEAEKERNEACP